MRRASTIAIHVAVLGVCIFAAGRCSLTQESASTLENVKTAPQPLWGIDLNKYGYQGRPPIHLGPEDTWGTWAYKQGVVFTQSNVVAAFFVIHDDSSDPKADERKALPSDRYRLRAVFLNTDDGEIIKQLDWPLPGTTQNISEPFFFPATGGRFVVGIGNTLSLYSPEFKILAQHRANAELEAIASPSGKTILLGNTQKVDGEWTERFDLLETESLSVLKTWNSPPQPDEILWDDEMAYMSAQAISVRTPDTSPQPLITHTQARCGNWSFIDRELIAMFECAPRGKLDLISTNGEIRRQFDLGLEQPDGPVVSSQDGTRFAVPTRHWGSGIKNPKQLLARVFAVDADKPILTLEVTPHYGAGPDFDTAEGDTRFGWGGLALSTGGRLLAVKSGQIVQLYQVPEADPSTPGNSDSAAANGVANSIPSPSPQMQDLSPSTAPSPQLIDQVLSWLPGDTETVIAVNGPFPLPSLDPQEEETGAKEPDEIEDLFKLSPLGLFGFDKGILGKYFRGEKILFALEGSRNFRGPTGLGEAPFEGCAIVAFDGDVSASAKNFLAGSSKDILRIEGVEDHEVAVFEEKREEDLWIFFVAFPKPNVALVATNEDYLREALSRLDGKRDERALPDALPEWKYVNKHAEFWALRHYSRRVDSTDPTSPSRGGELTGDDQAIGLAFAFDPAHSKTATVTYLSANRNVLPIIQEHLSSLEREPGGQEMQSRYREIAPGVVEGSYDLSHIESAEILAFVLGAFLGHVVLV